jgi:hypothetical protein
MKTALALVLFSTVITQSVAQVQLYAPEIKVSDTGGNIGISTLTPDSRLTIGNIGSKVSLR